MYKITVITVCYNALTELKKTIDSILSQDYPDMELVIVDGGSKDGTLQYLSSINNSILRWISEPDKGIYDAMNKGVGIASGQWIIFMNAADTFASANTISRTFADIPEDADIVYGDVIKDGNIKVAEQVHNSHRMFFCHQCAFVRKDLLLLYPFDLKYKMSADFKFFKTMVSLKKSFVKKEFPIANFDTTGVSNSRRSAGIRENIQIVLETDTLVNKLRNIPRLAFQYLMCCLRGK